MILLFIGDDLSYRQIEIEELKTFIKNNEEIGFDLETNGFFPQLSEITAIGIHANNYTIIFSKEHLYDLKEELESTVLIGHNLQFDLRFLYSYNIWPKYYDTMIAEKLLYQGLTKKGYKLNNLIERYLGIETDKSLQKIAGTLDIKDTKLHKYLKDDVQYLIRLKAELNKALQEQNLSKLFHLVENRYVEVLAYSAYHGFKIDVPVFKEILKNRISKLEELVKTLNSFIIKYKIEEFITYNTKTLFDKESSQVNINWRSPQQVIKCFNSIGIQPKDELTGKPTSSYKTIESFDHEIAKAYGKYGKLRKKVEGFGLNIEKLLRKFKDDHIRTSYNQILDTGRISSGGKTFDGFQLVNLQNPPRDEDDRKIYCAKDGYLLIIADYSQQEPRLLAEISGDEGYKEYATNPEKDIHCFFTQWKYPELANLSHKQIKTEHDSKRSECKPITFSITYQSTARTMALKTGFSEEMCQKAIDHYYASFPKIKELYEKAEKEAIQTGKIVINNITKRIRHFEDYPVFKNLQTRLNNDFYVKYNESKKVNGEFYRQNRRLVPKYYSLKNDLRKQSANTIMQGTGADMTKIAEIKIFDHIKKNDHINIVFMPNRIHDEIIIETPEELLPQYMNIVEQSMMESANIFLKTIPMKIGTKISKVWIK